MNKIWYHGTNKTNALKILKNGFKKGTYFADHFEDAIGYGGNYIFEVGINFLFKKGRKGKGSDWQVISANPISKSCIVSCKVFHSKTIFENEDKRREIFESSLERIKLKHTKAEK